MVERDFDAEDVLKIMALGDIDGPIMLANGMENGNAA
jgi:hypothetical protein